MTKIEKIDKDYVTEVFSKAFAEYVGPNDRLYPFSFQSFGKMIGAEPRTIKGWRDGQSLPYGWDLMKVFMVLGTEFLNKFLEEFGFTGVYELGGENPCVKKMNSKLGKLIHLIGDAIEDGFVDHQERDGIISAIDEAVPQMNAYKGGSN